jgi:hypothetical protein
MAIDPERALAPYLDEPPLARDVDPRRVGPYRGFAEIGRALLSLRERGARLSVAGRSREGTPLLRVDVGPADAPHRSLGLAGIHAMEWIGVETGLAILEQVLDLAPRDRRLVFFPIVNPDGFRRAERDLRAGKRSFVRANAAGVDLNRNWPTHWKTTRLPPRVLPFLGGSGEHPASEPEVRAILDAIDAEAHAGQEPHGGFERGLSLHSFGSMLLLPYGGRWEKPYAYPRLEALARSVQGALSTRYGIGTSARWVPGFFAFGMELDHLLHSGMDPLLVECSRGGLALTEPSSWVHPFRWFNPRDPAGHAADLAHALVPFLGYGRAR